MLTELLACAVGRSRSDALTNAKKKATERQFPAVTKVIIQSTERERESDRISSNWRHSWAMQMRPRVTYFSVRRRTRPCPIRFAPRSFRRRVQVCMWCGHVGWFTLPFLTLTDKTRVSSLSLSLPLASRSLHFDVFFDLPVSRSFQIRCADRRGGRVPLLSAAAIASNRCRPSNIHSIQRSDVFPLPDRHSTYRCPPSVGLFHGFPGSPFPRHVLPFQRFLPSPLFHEFLPPRRRRRRRGL